MKQGLLLLIFLVSVISCKKEDQLENEIAKINIDANVERFDVLFAQVTDSKLPDLKQAYPFMFSEKYTDSFWLAKASDSLQKLLFKEVNKTFNNFSQTELEVESLFNHLKYYFPEFQVPRIITVTSDVDYRNRVIVTDTIDIVALDNYLGSDHEFYQSIPVYLRENFNKEHIVVDLAGEYAKKYIYPIHNRTFLDEMIYFGKQLYFKDVMVPFKSEASRIGYTEEELEWAQTNESYIWRYFVEREMLFSTDSKLSGRFIAEAPFSKFYLEGIDSESPGQLGQYIGWQIVRAYMQHNEVSLKDMLITNAEEIFNNSKFKPRK
ncbi:gliding motility lipoprotein GldB [Aestuariibaculum suncheonense]|uniref:Gliding motility lipoprotein GldB n=1 Tax=Aestuariibaculum suncheonense TaxID=1028745 RepID=A0A8J6QWD7_9FLAO|nr:gliding motility lipoprotein GldB [Aestuariibaculum suncheonense]MBD0836139.1 gliding motility lipoprotein GldB [Aestuariibaculum suncheonense]